MLTRRLWRGGPGSGGWPELAATRLRPAVRRLALRLATSGGGHCSCAVITATFVVSGLVVAVLGVVLMQQIVVGPVIASKQTAADNVAAGGPVEPRPVHLAVLRVPPSRHDLSAQRPRWPGPPHRRQALDAVETGAGPRCGPITSRARRSRCGTWSCGPAYQLHPAFTRTPASRSGVLPRIWRCRDKLVRAVNQTSPNSKPDSLWTRMPIGAKQPSPVPGLAGRRLVRQRLRAVLLLPADRRAGQPGPSSARCCWWGLPRCSCWRPFPGW